MIPPGFVFNTKVILTHGQTPTSKFALLGFHRGEPFQIGIICHNFCSFPQNTWPKLVKWPFDGIKFKLHRVPLGLSLEKALDANLV